jgi:hydroxypyruvate isomerase
MPNFAANLTFMFNEWDFLDRFAAAADAGFTAVEYLFPYDYAPEVLADLLRAHGLQQVLFNLPAGNWTTGDRGLAALTDRRDEFTASIDTAMLYAEALATTRLHVMAGIAALPDAGALETYRCSIREVCARAAHRGITILIEPINTRDMPGYFLHDFALAADIVRDLALPNLRLQFDIYHRQMLHGDVLTALRALVPLIGHVQIASVPGRHEPGSGELDDFRVLRTLDALGYQGFVGLEYRPAGGTLAGLTWLDAFGAG